MQKIIIDIPDNKLNFFMELVNNLGFKKVHRLSNTQKELIKDLKQALSEVEQHEHGKIKLQPARDFLNEI